MKKKSELPQRIEAAIDYAIQNLEHISAGNFAHGRNAAMGALRNCKEVYIKKLKELLSEEE